MYAYITIDSDFVLKFQNEFTDQTIEEFFGAFESEKLNFRFSLYPFP